MTPVTPLSLQHAPALIERLLPVQKLSAEAYKEQMANQGKTLTALGSYWKGRKPLILNKACLLGVLLPATANPKRDLEIFEMLMGFDRAAVDARLTIKNSQASRQFIGEQDGSNERKSYRELVDLACRPEECGNELFDEIWEKVNEHLSTSAHSFPELVEQLGIMRFGHRPKIADTFSGSGQIPFEAARLGCDVYASDLNPVACMLTWGALHIVGATPEKRAEFQSDQLKLISQVQSEIDELQIETDGAGWRAKAFLYCLEVRCPQTGWMVPLIPSLVISRGKKVVATLVPDPVNLRYDIHVKSGATQAEMERATKGTVRTDGRGQDTYLCHSVSGNEYRTKISTLRGDFRTPDGINSNRLRPWQKSDFAPHPTDVFQERLYAIHWMRRKPGKKTFDYEFREITPEDCRREQIVIDNVSKNLSSWQDQGWIPDMRIEPGSKTSEPIRTRGWTHWHHLFNPRQLLLNAYFARRSKAPELVVGLCQALNRSCKLCVWDPSPGVDAVGHVFYNQALNTFFNYGCRSSHYLSNQLELSCRSFPLPKISANIRCGSAESLNENCDIFITDPPYGDAVNYDEILEFFIAWLRKNPPAEFADWTWDSRRSLAIKGDGEDFRRGMVAAYRRMTECMADNGVQVIMFTHQSGSIWGDMANIVWASGLQVTAAWYVVTETTSALREGSYVKGTVLLVCRKRQGLQRTTRDDLAWEIQEEVEDQIRALTGLNQEAKGLYRDENVFEDADIQMAGYAAALRVLTRYAVIDGRDMTAEAIRPRVKGETTFVDGLIAFAVDTANQCLVPQGIPERHWKVLTGAERFYLKLIDLEAKGMKTLDNYQNFAKAFKVRDFHALMGSQRANEARLRSAVEFGRNEMGEGAELGQTVLRSVLYAMMELVQDVDGVDVLAHLTIGLPEYYADMTLRERVAEVADYLAKSLVEIRPEEASAARVLRDLVRNQRLG